MFRLLILAVASVSTFAHAQQNGSFLTSEYFHQAEAGVFEITPGIGQAPGKASVNELPMGYRFVQTTYKNTSAKSNVTFLPIVADLEYGLTPDFAVGGELSYVTGHTSIDNCPSGSTCPSGDISGLADPQVFFKGRYGTGAGQLSYGISINVSLMKSWSDNQKSNVASGGFSYTPFVGFETQAGYGVWGARVAYSIAGERKTEDRAANTDDYVKGGNRTLLETFYEFPISGETTVGFALQYAIHATTESKSGSGTYSDDKSAGKEIALKAYTPMPMGTFTLLPSLKYSSYSLDDSNSGTDKMTGFEIGVAGRMTF